MAVGEGENTLKHNHISTVHCPLSRRGIVHVVIGTGIKSIHNNGGQCFLIKGESDGKGERVMVKGESDGEGERVMARERE